MQAIPLTFHVDNVAPVLTVSETVALAAAGPSPRPIRVLAGAATDGGPVRQLYALVKSPVGRLSSRSIARAGDTWQLNLTPETVGAYTLWVNAIDAAGNVRTAGPYVVTIIRLLAENDGPTALGASTALTATLLGDDGYMFNWNLGDGSTQPGAVAYHVYSASGTYTATVVAFNSVSAVTATTQVSVIGPIYLPVVMRN